MRNQKKINKKISKALKGRTFPNRIISKKTRKKMSIRKSGVPLSKAHRMAVIKGNIGKYFPNSILEVSARTVTKIMQRLKLGCSLCGWKKARCDFHHIRGKKAKNANNVKYVTYICPNCHRLVHSHKISKKSLIPVEVQIGEKWRDVYYG